MRRQWFWNGLLMAIGALVYLMMPCPKQHDDRIEFIVPEDLSGLYSVQIKIDGIDEEGNVSHWESEPVVMK